jgi:hypothetical protein
MRLNVAYAQGYHNLPKYTKINKKNTKQYLVYSWSKFSLFFHKREDNWIDTSIELMISTKRVF